jgi:hypothetical protein
MLADRCRRYNGTKVLVVADKLRGYWHLRDRSIPKNEGCNQT